MPLWLRLESHFLPRSARVRFVVVASFAIGLSFILSTGPALQLYVLALINSNQTSIYGSAYQTSLITFPTLFEWLYQAADWHMLLMAAAIAVISLRHLVPRKIAASAFTSSFVVLTLNDLVTAYVDHRVSFEMVIEDIIANFFGGIIICFLSVAILGLIDFYFKHAMEPLAIRRIVGAVLAVATSGLVSVFAFYAAELLYKPQPVQLDVLIGPPVNGALKPGKHLHEPIASPERSTPFNLISGNVEGGEAEWLSPDGQLETRWNSTSTDVPFTASIRLFDGCMQIKDYLHAAGPTPAFTLSNPRDLKVWFDQGASNLYIFNEKNQGRFKVVTDTILMYWVDRDERNNTIKLVEFVTQDDHLEFKQPPDAIEFFVSAYRFGADGTSATIRNRTLHIQSGEHEESIEFEGTFDRKENIACKELPTHELLLGEKTTIPESSAVVGVLVRIERGPTSIYNSDDNELRAVNGSGWISIDGLRDKDLSQAKPGDVSFIEFAGNIINLEVDGAQVTRNPAARYFSFGDFEGSFKRGGQLRFLGIAKALFKDRSRMNPTKWESLGWDRCAFLLGVIGSLLAAVAKFTTSVLKKNLSFGWLSL